MHCNPTAGAKGRWVKWDCGGNLDWPGMHRTPNIWSVSIQMKSVATERVNDHGGLGDLPKINERLPKLSTAGGILLYNQTQALRLWFIKMGVRKMRQRSDYP